MNKNSLSNSFIKLKSQFEGELYFDDSSLHITLKLAYATDASVYQEKPLAVAIPKTDEDIKQLIQFANQQNVTLIPRAAGTSLAGQVVGNGIVVDISKYFDKILEVNTLERWVRVQPGVIRDDLNAFLKPYGLMFGPETSTASRAMIGGMIGNNSCGLHSIVWGDTREHLISAKVLLSDGSEAEFKTISSSELDNKISKNDLEGLIYKNLVQLISNDQNKEVILKNYPKRTLKRRNTGYALDFLVSEDEQDENNSVNLCKLLAGSEGTLAFVTEAKLNLLPVPPKQQCVVCIHCSSISESLQANLISLNHKLTASELVDKFILDFTKGHPTYENYRFFIEGEPEAILMVEFLGETEETIKEKSEKLIGDLRKQEIGYAYPVITGDQVKLVWEVRKAGLGLIRNLPGDDQPVNLIEDCAVPPENLPGYIQDLQQVLDKYKLKASFYAHAGAGELHVEPIINLKTKEGKTVFRKVLEETAQLVKKHKGSLSGEHGDGRLRGEFIPAVLGDEVFELIKQVKEIFDPKGVFNANKIVNTPPMDEFLRFNEKTKPVKINTYFNYSEAGGILKLAEKCSGSGDCKKSHITGGVMCPSFMATREEKDSTRARANILRQFLTNSQNGNPFNHKEIKEVMDLCLSCKGCKSECPSQVDVGKMKAEFLQHYYDANGILFKTQLIGHFTKSQQLASILPKFYNYIIENKLSGSLIKKLLGFAPERSIPKLGNTTLRNWNKGSNGNTSNPFKKKVYLFCDEFTNYNDVEIGQTAIKLLNSLGYEVVVPKHFESGRTYLSKGMVRQAKAIINKNIELLKDLITEESPLIGIEPSSILTFRDEYLELADPELLAGAKQMAKHSFLIEEFLLQEVEKGNIKAEQFTKEERKIKLHGHCHQKAMNLVAPTLRLLSLPKNYKVETIPSGCCGMAGSFGYEKEHYSLSMKIGELVLFPTVKVQSHDTIIAASGTSCRHQIKDGTGRKALHPVEILWEALTKEKSLSE